MNKLKGFLQFLILVIAMLAGYAVCEYTHTEEKKHGDFAKITLLISLTGQGLLLCSYKERTND